MFAPARRPLVGVLLSSVLLVGAAGCGGDDAGSGGAAADVDAKALLRDAAKNAQAMASDADAVDLSMSVSGNFEMPDDEDVRKLDGKASIAVKASGLKEANEKKTLPTIAFTGTVDGELTDGAGKASKGAYTAGITIANQELFASWKGKDYTFGEGFSKQLLDNAAASAGASGGTAGLNIDPKKANEALDLQPDTWFAEPKAVEGPSIGGDETYAVGGEVEIKAAADDITTGLRNLGKAFPTVEGLQDTAGIKDIADGDVEKAEKSLSTRDVQVYVSKDSRELRGMKFHLAGSDGEGKSNGDVTIDIRFMVGGDVKITAPKNAAPFTDLLVALQSEFPSLGAAAGLGG